MSSEVEFPYTAFETPRRTIKKRRTGADKYNTEVKFFKCRQCGLRFTVNQGKVCTRCLDRPGWEED